jgi:hypothetical protein
MSRRACEGENPECPYFEEGCYSDLHHLYWPSPDYNDTISNKFRELPENKQQTCRDEHDQIHEGEPPAKPSYEVMEHAIVASGVHISRKVRKALNKQDGQSQMGGGRPLEFTKP